EHPLVPVARRRPPQDRKLEGGLQSVPDALIARRYPASRVRRPFHLSTRSRIFQFRPDLTRGGRHIEVSLRVEVAYRLGKIDTFAHLHEDSFHPTFRERRDARSGTSVFAAWQQKHQGLVNRSKEDFVKHYRQKHGPDMPIWVAIEVWD